MSCRREEVFDIAITIFNKKYSIKEVRGKIAVHGETLLSVNRKDLADDRS
jgi:hypothetical protein